MAENETNVLNFSSEHIFALVVQHPEGITIRGLLDSYFGGWTRIGQGKMLRKLNSLKKFRFVTSQWVDNPGGYGSTKYCQLFKAVVT